ncbi:MAG: divergent PAP2 family protein [bacterium]|nr:divergent PAP2 family protein [bacterium]
MNYFYLFFPFVVWLISQTIKFLVRLNQKQVPNHLKELWWVYVWAAGAPSTHAAILTSSLFLVWHNFGFSPIFTFCLVITMLWLFDIANDRKRQEVLNGYFMRDNSETLKKVVSDGYIIDLSGHTVYDLVWGAALGIVLGAIASYTIFLK